MCLQAAISVDGNARRLLPRAEVALLIGDLSFSSLPQPPQDRMMAEQLAAEPYSQPPVAAPTHPTAANGSGAGQQQEQQHDESIDQFNGFTGIGPVQSDIGGNETPHRSVSQVDVVPGGEPEPEEGPQLDIAFTTIQNDATDESYRKLVALKTLYCSRMPELDAAFVFKIIMDRSYNSFCLIKGGQIMGGITYRTFLERGFVELALLAIGPEAQAQYQDCGSVLLAHLKENLKSLQMADDQRLECLVTFADNGALSFYERQGFSSHLRWPVENYSGLITHYEGATLMDCPISHEIDYIEQLLQAEQQEADDGIHDHKSTKKINIPQFRHELRQKTAGDAEVVLADLEFDDNDIPEAWELKYGIMNVYNQILQERVRLQSLPDPTEPTDDPSIARAKKMLHARWEDYSRRFKAMVHWSAVRRGFITGHSDVTRPVGVDTPGEGRCSVCFGPGYQWDRTNPLLTCSACGVSVHKHCYGISDRECLKSQQAGGQWLCQPCLWKQKQKSQGLPVPDGPLTCLACRRKGGALRKASNHEWVHVTCALWLMPEAVCQNLEKMEGWSFEHLAEWRHKEMCSHCRNRGGFVVKCAYVGCLTMVHPMCAWREGLFVRAFESNQYLYWEGKADKCFPQLKIEYFCNRHTPQPAGGPPRDTEQQRQFRESLNEEENENMIQERHEAGARRGSRPRIRTSSDDEDWSEAMHHEAPKRRRQRSRDDLGSDEDAEPRARILGARTKNARGGRKDHPWAHCDSCGKWRRLPGIESREFADLQMMHHWECAMNRWDPEKASCDAPESDPGGGGGAGSRKGGSRRERDEGDEDAFMDEDVLMLEEARERERKPPKHKKKKKRAASAEGYDGPPMDINTAQQMYPEAFIPLSNPKLRQNPNAIRHRICTACGQTASAQWRFWDNYLVCNKCWMRKRSARRRGLPDETVNAQIAAEAMKAAATSGSSKRSKSSKKRDEDDDLYHPNEDAGAPPPPPSYHHSPRTPAPPHHPDHHEYPQRQQQPYGSAAAADVPNGTGDMGLGISQHQQEHEAAMAMVAAAAAAGGVGGYAAVAGWSQEGVGAHGEAEGGAEGMGMEPSQDKGYSVVPAPGVMGGGGMAAASQPAFQHPHPLPLPPAHTHHDAVM
ncbi:unnamed protein product [Vitrella brassicaformis CCMP3155]|uniref:Histone acetyltransferase n=5 Tax=Vitrella brassicaformis TaxID=1169539 RepID=A0A0G4ESQ7_VITBC|nr:unnamed protein product [Vitrella brassicaformis CCMP3155]|eukprot:CEM01677.1 unnamed protein product [Vitrella brassicaformis CCMP3155]